MATLGVIVIVLICISKNRSRIGMHCSIGKQQEDQSQLDIYMFFFPLETRPPRQKPGQIFTVSHNSHSQFLTLPCSVLINSWLCNEPFGHSSGNKAQSRPVSAPENRKPSTVVIRREILELYLDGLISTSNNPKPPVPKPPPSLPTFELPTLQQPIHNWKRSKNPSHYLWARLRAARPFSG